MAEKLSWNAQKKEFWKMNTRDLMKKLQELETILFKKNMDAFKRHKRRQAYVKGDRLSIKDLRHKVACLKTILNVKLKQ